jgi:predicted thioesterase
VGQTFLSANVRIGIFCCLLPSPFSLELVRPIPDHQTPDTRPYFAAPHLPKCRQTAIILGMKTSLCPGVVAEARHRVVTENLLSSLMPGAPPVFATPWMLCVMETAAAQAIAPHLDAGETSVGYGFEFHHLAPTPAGMTIIATAEVTKVEGNMVTLNIEARDNSEVIGRGSHVRAVIELERFNRRVKRKSGG